MAEIRRPTNLPLRPTTRPISRSTTTSDLQTTPSEDTLPSQILPHLFVGNQEQTNSDTLNRLNISYILSLGLLPLISDSQTLLPSKNSSKDFKIKSIQCKCINIADSSEQILSKFFDEAHQFIDEARRNKCNILVHCFAGISRSPTIVIAYLMRADSLKLQDAYNLVARCRPQTDPNLCFMGQLIAYERSLGGKQPNLSSFIRIGRLLSN